MNSARVFSEIPMLFSNSAVQEKDIEQGCRTHTDRKTFKVQQPSETAYLPVVTFDTSDRYCSCLRLSIAAALIECHFTQLQVTRTVSAWLSGSALDEDAYLQGL